MCSRTLQNSARRPRAVRRAVSVSNCSSGAPCRAATPSSASISCCRMRSSSARIVRSGTCSLGWGSTTGVGSPLVVTRGNDPLLAVRVPHRPGTRLDRACFRRTAKKRGAFFWLGTPGRPRFRPIPSPSLRTYNYSNPGWFNWIPNKDGPNMSYVRACNGNLRPIGLISLRPRSSFGQPCKQAQG